MGDKKIVSYNVADVSGKNIFQGVEGFVISGSPEIVRQMFASHPHIVDGIAFSICTKGYSRLKINLREYLIEEGMILIILPNTLIEPLDDSEDLQISSMFFKYDFISEFPLATDFNILRHMRNLPCLLVSKEKQALLLDYHLFIGQQLAREDVAHRKEVIKYLLFAFITELKALYFQTDEVGAASSRMDEISKRFFNLLYGNYKQQRSVAFYADKMNLTPKYLTTIIRKATDQSISLWINEAVISYAKSILKSTDKTIQEIAYDLNFSESSIFCRFFKRYAAMTPSKYRAKG